MSENNGNSKWMMWAVGVMLTVGMAAQAGQMHYVNMRFTDHETRPHRQAISRDRFEDIYNELVRIRTEITELEKQVARLEERLRNR